MARETLAPELAPAPTTTKLPEIDARTISVEKDAVSAIVTYMETAGVCVVRNLVSRASVNQILNDTAPYLDRSESCLSKPSATDSNGWLLI